MNKWVWIPWAVVLASSAAFGQSEPGGTITITSRPPGCTIYLSGDVELVTTAPVTLQEKLQGLYVVRALRPGYEIWRSTITFTPGTAQTVNIDLQPKTRLKAGVRSLIIPGWGQYYAGEKPRSVLWGVAALSSGVVAALYESRYRNRKDDWENSRRRFDEATTIEEKENARQEVFRLQDRAYDAETDRRWAWGIVGGVWVVNLLDAVIFFPAEERFTHLPLTLRPTPDGAGATFTLTFTHKPGCMR